jgi:hypothetical protein
MHLTRLLDSQVILCLRELRRIELGLLRLQLLGIQTSEDIVIVARASIERAILTAQDAGSVLARRGGRGRELLHGGDVLEGGLSRVAPSGGGQDFDLAGKLVWLRRGADVALVGLVDAARPGVEVSIECTGSYLRVLLPGLDLRICLCECCLSDAEFLGSLSGGDLLLGGYDAEVGGLQEALGSGVFGVEGVHCDCRGEMVEGF